eukprot:11188061-Lingulodinium_polyedra.AAC.1
MRSRRGGKLSTAARPPLGGTARRALGGHGAHGATWPSQRAGSQRNSEGCLLKSPRTFLGGGGSKPPGVVG